MANFPALCIGGPKAGQYVECIGEIYTCPMMEEPIYVSALRDDHVMDSPIETFTYERMP